MTPDGGFPPYRSYTRVGVEAIRQIPAHWQLVPLKRIGEITYGIGEPPPYRTDGVPLIRATNVSKGRIQPQGLMYVDPKDIPASRIVWLQPGDIVVVRSGAYTGDSAIIPGNYGACIAGFDMVLRCRTECSPQFIQYALLSAYLKDHQIDLERMRAAQPHLNAEELGMCLACVPPRSEQLAITTFLDRETAKIDTLIEKQERLIALLTEKRQAVISHAVTRGLDPNVRMKDSGVEWLGGIPEYWAIGRAKNLVSSVTSGSRGWAEHYADEGAIFVRIANLTRHGVDLDLSSLQSVLPPNDAEAKRSEVREGDIVVSITADLGSVAVIPQLTQPAYVSQHVALLKPTEGCYPRWLAYVIRSRTSQEQLAQAGYGGTKIQLSLDDVRNLWIATPPFRDQQLIADFLDSELARIDSLIEKARRSIELMKERRSALISAAVTGQIDVREAA